MLKSGFLAILCVALIHGANCDSNVLDTVMTTLNSVYQQYRDGTLLNKLAEYVKDFISGVVEYLERIQNSLSTAQTPQIQQTKFKPPQTQYKQPQTQYKPPPNFGLGSASDW